MNSLSGFVVFLLGQAANICFALPVTEPSTTLAPTTTLPTTTERTTLPGCLVNGVIYPVGSHQTGDDRASNWCYGIYCNPNGEYYSWDNFNCHPSSPTTTPPTTLPPSPGTDQPKGCVFQGRFYLDNTMIQEALDKNGNPCQLTYCNSKGELIQQQRDCVLVG